MDLTQMLLSAFMFFADVPDSNVMGSRACDADKLRRGDVVVAYTGDGDTLALRTGDGTIVKTRLAGIDTPETHFNKTDQGPWAFEAATRLKELLPKGTRVRLELSGSPCDSHNRTIAHVFAGETHVNRQMVSEGWAVNYCVAPNYEYCEDFRELVDENIRLKRGFLADPSVKLPYIFRIESYGGEPRYFVGDIDSKKVSPARFIDRVTISQRVFFYSQRRVTPPYRME